MSVAIQTSQNVLLEYEPASIGERILATLIDYLVFLGWILLTLAVPGGVLDLELTTFYLLLCFLPILVYDLLCEYLLNGQSLGKIAMGIRVVMLDGSQPGLGAYLLRWLLRIVDIQSFRGLVAIIAIAANGKGQRVGDMAAGTTVIRLKSTVSLDQLRPPALPDDYQVRFPEVRQLSDRDIAVVRAVLTRGTVEAVQRTAAKIKSVTGITTDEPDVVFLRTVLDDYQFITMQD